LYWRKSTHHCYRILFWRFVSMRERDKQTIKQAHLNLFLSFNYSNWHTITHKFMLRILILLFSFSHLCDIDIDID
jgi:hypothetical protein